MLLPSRLDLYETGRRYLVARARKIDPTVVDTQGSDANLVVGSNSFVAAAVVRQLADRTNALTLDGAVGEDLDRYALDRYQEKRKGAGVSRGRVRLFRSSLAGGSGTVDAGAPLLTLTGAQYVTVTPASFGTDTFQARADVRAVEAGPTPQVGRNQIRAFGPGFQPFDRTIQVTNDEPTAGGDPAEQDDEFRERLRDFWRTARRGVLSAIEFGAKGVSGVSSASASEALDGGGRPARVVRLHFADASGSSSLALADEVGRNLFEFRAAGIAVVFDLSLPQLVSIVLHLSFIAGVDTAGVTAQVRAAVVEYVNSLPVNANLTRPGLSSVLQRFQSAGLVPADGNVVAPAGDLLASPGTSFRTRLENVTAI